MLRDFHTANTIAWNLYLLTGSSSWLQRASSMREEDDSSRTCCFMYLGLTEIHTNQKNALVALKKAERLALNPGQLGATIALQIIAGEPKWSELEQAWSGTHFESEISTLRKVASLMNGPRPQIAAFFQNEEQRPRTEIHERQMTYLVRLGGFDLDDVWRFILNGRAEKPTLGIDLDYAFCVLPDGIRIDLSRRGPMKKILKALVIANSEDRAGLTTWEAMEAGWPTDKVRSDAAIAKLYTTINNLRKLGFRDIIETSDEGYRLSRDYSVQIL